MFKQFDVYKERVQQVEVKVINWSISGALLAAALFVTPAFAQESNPFGGFKHDRTQPIEITSTSLEVFQAKNLAIFEGDVIAGQGTMRLTTVRLEVIFDPEQDSNDESGAIKHLTALGDVFISNGAETAQGDRAEYDVETGLIKMFGSVVLTQGENVIAGDTLDIDTNGGQGRVAGRVKSIFKPSKKASEADENTQ